MAAHAHYSTALSLFRKAVGTPTRENTTALFACSTLVVVAALACPRSSPSDSFVLDGQEMFSAGNGNEDDRAFEWMRLARGVRCVLDPVRDVVRDGYLREQTMASFRLWHVNIPLEPSVATQLAQLSQLVAEDVDPVVRESCQDAVQHLSQTLGWMQEEREGSCVVSLGLMWTAVVTDAYFELLVAGHPVALVVAAHYCVVMGKLKEVWWVSGWALVMLRSIERRLEGSWEEWLVWPMQMLGVTAHTK